MTIKDNEFVDLPGPRGPMRTYVFRPAAPGRYPGILFYSEIFQVTELAALGYGLAIGLFRRKLGEGDLRVAAAGPAETRH